MVYLLLLRSGVPEWLGIEDDLLQNAAALVAAGLVYLALRVAERYQPQIGWLLGYAKQPVYALPAVVATAESKVNLLNQQVTDANARNEAGKVEGVVLAALIIAGALILIFLLVPALR